MRVSFRSAIRYALLIGVLMPVFLVSCTTTVVPSGEIPRGFALWEDEQTDPGQWSALSPEGVRYRVRVVENRPPQNLAFWSRALESRMISRGFLPLGEPFSFAGGEGWGAEWAVPYGSRDFVFLTALMAAPEGILIAEAAGEVSLYTEYRESLKESLETLELLVE